jgi:hypothetical protein
MNEYGLTDTNSICTSWEITSPRALYVNFVRLPMHAKRSHAISLSFDNISLFALLTPTNWTLSRRLKQLSLVAWLEVRSDDHRIPRYSPNTPMDKLAGNAKFRFLVELSHSTFCAAAWLA